MTTWAGSCHCGDVRFEVDGEIDEVLDCNCSICKKKGLLHWIVTPDRFRLLAGEQALTTYTFGTGIAKHTFCRRCGVQPFYQPRSHPGRIDVNARCLDGVDVATLDIRAFDGRADWERSRRNLPTEPPESPED